MILIVDDRPENIFSLKSILELHAFPVDSAGSGEEALKKTLKQKYALIILDVQMPGMDGFEVAEILSGNSQTKDIPIIFLSAVSTEKKFITKGYNSGAIDYIIKPIDPDILLLKVKTFVRLYEQNRELNLMQENLRSEIEFRKKTEQQIQDKAQELHGILEAIPQIAFTATSTGLIDFVNENWYSYSDSITRFIPSHPDDISIKELWNAAVISGNELEAEVRIRKLNSDVWHYHLLIAIPITENGAVVKWVGTFTDINEQKMAVKRKDDFLTIASHELKTPLTSIKAYVQLLDTVTPPETDTKPYVDRTLLQVNKLDTLINDLLDISKIENGKLNFDLKETDFDQLIDRTLEMLQQIYPSNNIIREGHAGVKVMANAVRLEQVIINFVSNAVKYAPGSKDIKLITKKQEDGKIYFGVQDFGIGISQADSENIFNKFFRVSDTDSTPQGLGIGLYICAEILRKHHAGFGVESEPGKGSVFWIELPQK